MKHEIEAEIFIINILVKIVASESIGGDTMIDGDCTCNLNIIPSMKCHGYCHLTKGHLTLVCLKEKVT